MLKRPYFRPTLTTFGDVAAITGLTGGPSAGDVLLDENGNEVLIGLHSIDACAQQNDKCICADNGTC